MDGHLTRVTDPRYRELAEGPQETKDSDSSVVAYLSRDTWDGYGERFAPSGWVVPEAVVISFNHLATPVATADKIGTTIMERLPVAVPVRIWADTQGLLAHYRYLVQAEGRLGELARVLYYLEKEGALRGHSHWFEPLGWQERDGKGGTREMGDPYPKMPVKGRTYTRQLLREGGPVLAPANTDALTVAVREFARRHLPVPAGFGVADGELPNEGTLCLTCGRTAEGSTTLARASEDTEWDAGAARQRIAKWASRDGSGDKDQIQWAKYRQAFFWHANGAEAETFGGYKLAFADVIDGRLKAVWRAVAASMAVLMGARGGVDIPAAEKRIVYERVAAYYRQWDKEPPEYRSLVTLGEVLQADWFTCAVAAEVQYFRDYPGERPVSATVSSSDGERVAFLRRVSQELKRTRQG